MVKKAGIGKKAYPLYTWDRLTRHQRLNPNLSQEIKFALGKPAEEQIAENETVIRENKQKLKEAKHQEKILNETVAKQQKAAQEKRG